MISNTKHDGTHKTPENVDPRLHTPLDRRKLTLAQSKERSSNKNAFFPITHSNYQPSHATHTSKPFLSDAHISLFYPRFKKNTEENATPIFFVLSLSLSLASSPNYTRLPLAESQPPPHAYSDPYMLAPKTTSQVCFLVFTGVSRFTCDLRWAAGAEEFTVNMHAALNFTSQ